MGTKIPLTPKNGWYHGIKFVIPFVALYIRCIIEFSLRYSSPFKVILMLSISTLISPSVYFLIETPFIYPASKSISIYLSQRCPDHVTAADGTVTLTDGAQLDCGAVGKGYSLDCVKEALDQSGTAGYGTVSMTSSILCYGEKPDGKPFQIEIRDPSGDGTLGTVSTDSCFLSTSGGYERYFIADDGKQYCHILDPKTGMPAESDLTTVTVFCDSGLQSDFLSTLIWLEGTEHLEEHLHAEDYQIVAQDQSGKLYVSDGLHFTPNA